jgi:LmbE family N-acetylglucosaminyl deacetylase
MLPPSSGIIMSTVLVIGAHPDDETLGVGATLARHVAEGDDVHALILCEGMSLRYPDAEDDFLAAEARAAARILGFTSLTLTGLPDQGLDRLSLVEIAAPIEQQIRALQPNIVYTHWRGDINKDHVLVYDATLVATRCKEKSIDKIYAYETPSETEWGIPYDFSPNYFVDVGRYLDTKVQAMACYASQSPAAGHPRSVEHLRIRALYWGQCMMMGAAEAFVLLREYWR